MILVKNARFFYDGRKVRENVSVVIDGEDRAEVGVDKGDVVVDGSGKILIPAF
ncbi:TPA: amidohydrolase, partial [Candidatus Micrarchaeota archaeon]|nr:amidohydrolase [Candidatus Micrarchaeota archaeon]